VFERGVFVENKAQQGSGSAARENKPLAESYALQHLTHLDLSQNVFIHGLSNGLTAIEGLVHMLREPYTTQKISEMVNDAGQQRLVSMSQDDLATRIEEICEVSDRAYLNSLKHEAALQHQPKFKDLSRSGNLSGNLFSTESRSRSKLKGAKGSTEAKTKGAKESVSSSLPRLTHCPQLTSLNLNGNHNWGSNLSTGALMMALVRVRPRLHWLGAIPTVNRYGGDPADLTRASERSESALGASTPTVVGADTFPAKSSATSIASAPSLRPAPFPPALLEKLPALCFSDGLCEGLTPLTLVEMRLVRCMLDDGDLVMLARYIHLDGGLPYRPSPPLGSVRGSDGGGGGRDGGGGGRDGGGGGRDGGRRLNTNAGTLEVLDLSQNKIYGRSRAGSEMHGFSALWEALISLGAYTAKGTADTADTADEDEGTWECLCGHTQDRFVTNKHA
jgi:hypothetical protein